ncbi:MAG: phage tail sheath protein FI [Crocinitomix sp.]|jgi:phage tail sheath protein FI
MIVHTPGVYIQERNLLPASVSGVSTAVPAFIGITAKQAAVNVPKRITSMFDYINNFGGKHTSKFDVDNTTLEVIVDQRFFLYDSLDLYFRNGGGPCYIVSAGIYASTDNIDIVGKLNTAIANLDDLDEVTLALMPDAHYQWKDGLTQKGIDGVSGYAPLASALIQKCAELKDKFAILDYYQPTSSQNDMRSWVSPIQADLKYGSLYYPWLKTTQQQHVSTDQLILSAATSSIQELALNTINADLIALDASYGERYNIDSLKADYAAKSIAATTKGGLTTLVSFLNKLVGVLDRISVLSDTTVNNYRISLSNNPTFIENAKHLLWLTKELETGSLINTVAAVNKPIDSWINTAFGPTYTTLATLEVDAGLLSYSVPNTGVTAVKNAAVLVDLNSAQYVDLNVIFSAIAGLFETAYARKQMIEGQLFTEDPIYKQAKSAVENFLKQMPAQGAVTGIYCKNDRERGVWKSPANIAVQSIEKPLVEVSNAEQDGLNVDAQTGKSINVIRTFAGKGALVWGARTLDGQSNEWRYIAVRRFFNYAEESIKIAMNDFVFEPNNARTWVKIKAMITSFLVEQWKAGALLGASYDEAFYVRVGEDTTSEQEILNGIINVQIGLAVARPAEFIILEFSHYTKS